MKNCFLFKFFIFFLLIFLCYSNPVSAYQIKVNPPAGSAAGLGDIISKGITAAIILAALLTFLYLVWAGIEWLTSGGDKEKYESARNKITAAVIGLAIVVASYTVMQLIAHFFGFDLTNLKIPQINTQKDINLPTTHGFPDEQGWD